MRTNKNFEKDFVYVLINELRKAMDEHFNQKMHTVSNMKLAVSEKLFSSDPVVRKDIKYNFIAIMITRYKGNIKEK